MLFTLHSLKFSVESLGILGEAHQVQGLGKSFFLTKEQIMLFVCWGCFWPLVFHRDRESPLAVIRAGCC